MRPTLTRFALVLAALLALATPALAQNYRPQPIGVVTFLAEPGMAYDIMSDCTITAHGRTVARVQRSYDPAFSWTYYIPRTGQRYGVERDGSVWANDYGRWIVVGHAVWSRTC